MAAAAGLTEGFSSRRERLDGRSRLPGVDLARGLAVLGMLAAHLLEPTDPFSFADPSTWTDVASGRSSILFAVLAGVSLALVTGGRVPVTGAARRRASARLAVRAGLLWAIGILLVFLGLPVFVILPAYALLFLLALPFAGLSARTLALAAVALGLVMPFVQAWLDALPFWYSGWGPVAVAALGWHYPFPVWIAFVLAGMAVGRTDLRGLRAPAVLTVLGIALALLGYGLEAVTGADAYAQRTVFLGAVWTADAHSSGLLEVVGSGGFALAVIGLCVLLCRTPARHALLPLRAVGAMPLTAYTAQLLVWAVVAETVLDDTRDLAGIRALDLFWPLALGLVVGCSAWALAVGRGPLEAFVDRVARAAVRSDPPVPADRLDA